MRALALAILLGTLAAPRAFPQAALAPRQITVSGTAEIKVPPDEIYLRVGVDTRHETIHHWCHRDLPAMS